VSGRKGTAATMETFMAGPMAYDDESLTRSEADALMDRKLREHAIEWHRGQPPETIPDSIRKELNNA